MFGISSKALVFSSMAFLLSCAGPVDDEIFAGRYIYGHEVSEFRPCDEDKAYWLSSATELIAEVRALASSQAKPYTPVYLKFRGHEIFEMAEGFRADYDYQLYLSEVIEFSADYPQTCR